MSCAHVPVLYGSLDTSDVFSYNFIFVTLFINLERNVYTKSYKKNANVNKILLLNNNSYKEFVIYGIFRCFELQFVLIPW